MIFLQTLFLFALGAALGSFWAAALYRIPRRQSLRGRSHCPSCGKQIRDQDNLPVIGWLALQGRSRCCRETISPRYLMIELGAGLVGAAMAPLGLAIPFLIGAGLLSLAVVTVAEIRSRES